MPGQCPTSDLFAYRKEGMMEPFAGKQAVCPSGYEHQILRVTDPYDYCISGLWRKTDTVSVCKSKLTFLELHNFPSINESLNRATEIRCLVPQSVSNGEWSFTSKQDFHQVAYNCNWGFAMKGTCVTSEC